jgi:tetratricopeptide (TPR) repeat protein
MNTFLTPSDELLLAKLGIEPSHLPTVVSLEKIDDYIAAINWLTDYKPKPDASSLEQVQGYLEAIHHLCKVQADKLINFLLTIPITVDSGVDFFSLPLCDYLTFKGLYRNLLEISNEIISSFSKGETGLNSVFILKARALEGNGLLKDAQDIYEEVGLKSVTGSANHIEATARLGMCQIQAGLYQIGVSNVQKALISIESFLDANADIKSRLRFLDLKTDIFNNLAYVEMNQCNFEKSIKLYLEVFESRKANKIIHKLVAPLVHQGILLRRIGEYKGAILRLSEAREKAREVKDEQAMTWIAHHLAWVLLNQGNVLLAEEQGNISLEGYKKVEDKRGISDSYEQLGFIYLAKDKFKKAKIFFELAFNIRNEIGNRHGIASCTMGLALSCWHNKQYLEFTKFLIQGFQQYYQIRVLNRARLLRILKLAYVWTIGKRNWTI